MKKPEKKYMPDIEFYDRPRSVKTLSAFFPEGCLNEQRNNIHQAGLEPPLFEANKNQGETVEALCSLIKESVQTT